jgi:hypothetical protein
MRTCLKRDIYQFTNALPPQALVLKQTDRHIIIIIIIIIIIDVRVCIKMKRIGFGSILKHKEYYGNLITIVLIIQSLWGLW